MAESTLEILDRAQEWYKEFESENGSSGPLYWPRFSSLSCSADDSANGKVVPISFYFPSFSLANCITAYWSTLMVGHAIVMIVYSVLVDPKYELLSSSSADDQDLYLLHSLEDPKTVPASSFPQLMREHYIKWKSMVTNICQSVEFMMQDKMGIVGPINTLSLLRGCSETIDSHAGMDRELTWIKEQMQIAQARTYFPTYKKSR